MAGKRKSRDGAHLRADGRWEGRTRLADGSLKSVYAATKAEVLVKLNALRHERDQGLLPTSDGGLTVAAYFERWLSTIEPRVKPRTFVRYVGEVRNHLLPAVGRLKLAKLSAGDLEGVYSGMQRKGLAPASVAHLAAVIHKGLSTAYRQRFVPQNVAALATAPSARTHRKEMQVLSRTQANALLAAARGDKLEALYMTALSSGARLGELLALRWSDVDFAAGTLAIEHSLHYAAAGAWVLGTPKTARGRRRIELTTDTARAQGPPAPPEGRVLGRPSRMAGSWLRVHHRAGRAAAWDARARARVPAALEAGWPAADPVS
jgi:integrase